MDSSLITGLFLCHVGQPSVPYSMFVKDLVFPRLDTHQECGLALFLNLLWIVVGVVIVSIFYFSWKNFCFISMERIPVDLHPVCLP